MPVRVNGIVSNFKVKANLENYPVLNGITIETGDLVKFVELDGQTCITNELASDDYVEGIARFGGGGDNVVPVYVLIYRARYRDLVFPYVVLDQFTNDEIRTKLISHELSKQCSAFLLHNCAEISKYNCDNLNTYGVRSTTPKV